MWNDHVTLCGNNVALEIKQGSRGMCTGDGICLVIWYYICLMMCNLPLGTIGNYTKNRNGNGGDGGHHGTYAPVRTNN